MLFLKNALFMLLVSQFSMLSFSMDITNEKTKTNSHKRSFDDYLCETLLENEKLALQNNSVLNTTQESNLELPTSKDSKDRPSKIIRLDQLDYSIDSISKDDTHKAFDNNANDNFDYNVNNSFFDSFNNSLNNNNNNSYNNSFNNNNSYYNNSLNNNNNNSYNNIFNNNNSSYNNSFNNNNNSSYNNSFNNNNNSSYNNSFNNNTHKITNGKYKGNVIILSNSVTTNIAYHHVSQESVADNDISLLLLLSEAANNIDEANNNNNESNSQISIAANNVDEANNNKSNSQSFKFLPEELTKQISETTLTIKDKYTAIEFTDIQAETERLKLDQSELSLAKWIMALFPKSPWQVLRKRQNAALGKCKEVFLHTQEARLCVVLACTDSRDIRHKIISKAFNLHVATSKPQKNSFLTYLTNINSLSENNPFSKINNDIYQILNNRSTLKTQKFDITDMLNAKSAQLLKIKENKRSNN